MQTGHPRARSTLEEAFHREIIMRAYDRVGRRFESRATPIAPSTPNTAKLAAAILCALGVVATAHAATFEVHSAADSGPDTLRQAVLDANATAGPHRSSSRCHLQPPSR